MQNVTSHPGAKTELRKPTRSPILEAQKWARERAAQPGKRTAPDMEVGSTGLARRRYTTFGLGVSTETVYGRTHAAMLIPVTQPSAQG